MATNSNNSRFQDSFFGTYFGVLADSTNNGGHYNGYGDTFIIVANLKRISFRTYIVSGYEKPDGTHVPAVQVYRSSDGDYNTFEEVSKSFYKTILENGLIACGENKETTKTVIVPAPQLGSNMSQYALHIKCDLDNVLVYISKYIYRVNEDKAEIFRPEFNVKNIHNFGETEKKFNYGYGAKLVTFDYIMGLNTVSGVNIMEDVVANERLKDAIQRSDKYIEDHRVPDPNGIPQAAVIKKMAFSF
jgi:hypothetical protein